MDNTKTYIKMSDCPEIQEQWKPTKGDWIFGNSLPYQYYEGGNKIYIYGDWIEPSEDYQSGWLKYDGCSSGTMDSVDFIPVTWLPRQDQLQEILELPSQVLALDFSSWMLRAMAMVCIPTIDKPSMEQLWLAFVMKEKHDKIWDGETWIPAKPI